MLWVTKCPVAPPGLFNIVCYLTTFCCILEWTNDHLRSTSRPWVNQPFHPRTLLMVLLPKPVVFPVGVLLFGFPFPPCSWLLDCISMIFFSVCNWDVKCGSPFFQRDCDRPRTTLCWRLLRIVSPRSISIWSNVTTKDAPNSRETKCKDEGVHLEMQHGENHFFGHTLGLGFTSDAFTFCCVYSMSDPVLE